MLFIKALLKKSYIRYLLSGGTAFVAEYLTFVLLIAVGSPILIANSASFIIGLIVSFTLNKKVVFASQGKTKSQFATYVGIAAVNLLLSNVIISFFVGIINMDPLIAKIVMIALIACWNYILLSKIVFRK